MKTTLVIILLVASAFAQYQSPLDAAEAACGPKDVKFEVKSGAPQPAAPNKSQPGKAIVYVIEDLGQCSDCTGRSNAFSTNVANALTKVGLDGAWVGANQGNSYFFFTVEPGEHHLCINWQSRLQVRSRAFAMSNFTADAGTVYYFRERLFPGNADYSFDLDPINTDEGKYLVATSSYSIAHSKK
jgi:hypothetical protein